MEVMLDIVCHLFLSEESWCLLNPQSIVRKGKDNNQSTLSKMGTLMLPEMVRFLQDSCTATGMQSYSPRQGYEIFTHELYCSDTSHKRQHDGRFSEHL